MNIFYLDEDVKKCARYHTDSHVIKMILESAQILCTVLWETGSKAPYKPTHQNHPCVRWAGESLSNWFWLRELSSELNKEYKYRFNKIDEHESYKVILSLPEPAIPDLGITKRPQAVPEKYKSTDTLTAYRNYYRNEKKHLAHWTKRKRPQWFIG